MTEEATATANSGGETSSEGGSLRGDLGTAPEFSVPEAYADKAWAGNIKSLDDLYSQFDNAQSMIGKKAIPSAEDGDEAWSEFFDQLRPESADKYDMTTPEGFEGEINEELQGKFKELFHEIGLNQRQVNRLFEGYLQLNSEYLGQEQTPEQIEAEFGDMIKERFGDGASDAIKIANKYIAMLPEGASERFQTLPNDVLIDVVDSYNQFHKMYSKEDGAPDVDSSVTGASPTKQDLIQKATELRRSEALKDPFHADNAKVRQELSELDARIQKLFG